MQLHDLLRRFDPASNLNGVANPLLSGIADDSRTVQPGGLFVARMGTKTDGATFVAQAVQNGAAAVVSASALPGMGVPVIVIPDIGERLSALANAFYDSPSGALRVLGITGTNGKTTSAYLVRHILSNVGKKCGMIGTVEIDDGQTRRESDLTTPGALATIQLLASMRKNKCVAAVMETSSHALDQGRVAGVSFAGAAFTNLTGDHLDYHRTMDAYADAKAKLFESLEESSVAVVNRADAWSSRMTRGCRAKVVTFGFTADADYRAADVAVTSHGSNFVLHTPDGEAEVRIGLIGRHNVENALTAAALVGEAMGLSVHQIAQALADANGAPGRLQQVRAGQAFAVLVDYAHTDDALKNVLTALRPLTRGKLRVLFGCGGDRDRTKRPRMAATAQALADVVYITSDNPRKEQPMDIIEEIRAGITRDADEVHVEPDRRRAIDRIIQEAGENDVVLLAGKGHENYQIVGTTKHHFDDVEEATRAVGDALAGV